MDMTAFDEVAHEGLRKQVRGLLLELAQGLELLVSRGGSVATEPSSRRSLDPTYITAASLLFAVLSAADHLRALGKLLGEPKVTVSIEPISRGVIEALARARWIAEGVNTDAAAARTLSLLRKDASTSGSTSVYQARSMGNELSMNDYIEELDKALEAVGGKVDVPRPTALSTSLLKAAFPTMDGRRKYAELSAIAHGSAAAIGPYATVHGSLRLPKLIMLNTVGAVIGCVDSGVHAVAAAPIEVFRNNAVGEIWIPVINRISPVIDGLRGQDLPD